ncbi:glucose 1-dehydrogenase [Streptomyces sp. NPDC093109]|uniref:SDR family NAD(P)-dependent oxidoreductase n=1 Tax=Streptomyces sp. NPDC093109 TaxID=3154977 RepID=UPI00344C5346
MQELAGKVALVVGAGSIASGIGNGRATAITFAREGATVICADIDEKAVDETARMIHDEGLRASTVQLDVTDFEAVGRTVSGVIAEHGRIDVLHNNVGINSLGSVVDIDLDEFDRVMRVNLNGAVHTMREVIPHMVGNGGGSIINISSLASLQWGGVSYAAYYASKAALNHITRTTAIEFAPQQVRVNSILPGLIKTPMAANVPGLAESYSSQDIEEMWRTRDRMVPMGRMGEAWDVANAALYLASDRAKYITGIDLVVDGGLNVGRAAV